MRYALGHRSSPFYRFGAICGVPSVSRMIFIDTCPQPFHQVTSISERAVEAVVVIEIGLVMPDGLPVMDIYNIVFKSLFGFCFWFLRTGQ